MMQSSTVQPYTQGSHDPASKHTPEAGAVYDFTCLFTRDIVQKKKKWQDGRFTFHTWNNRIWVHDERGHSIGDRYWLSGISGLEPDEEFYLDSNVAIVRIGESLGSRLANTTEMLTRVTAKRRADQGSAVFTHGPSFVRPSPSTSIPGHLANAPPNWSSPLQPSSVLLRRGSHASDAIDVDQLQGSSLGHRLAPRNPTSQTRVPSQRPVKNPRPSFRPPSIVREPIYKSNKVWAAPSRPDMPPPPPYASQEAESHNAMPSKPLGSDISTTQAEAPPTVSLKATDSTGQDTVLPNSTDNLNRVTQLSATHVSGGSGRPFKPPGTNSRDSANRPSRQVPQVTSSPLDEAASAREQLRRTAEELEASQWRREERREREELEREAQKQRRKERGRERAKEMKEARKLRLQEAVDRKEREEAERELEEREREAEERLRDEEVLRIEEERRARQDEERRRRTEEARRKRQVEERRVRQEREKNEAEKRCQQEEAERQKQEEEEEEERARQEERERRAEEARRKRLEEARQIRIQQAEAAEKRQKEAEAGWQEEEKERRQQDHSRIRREQERDAEQRRTIDDGEPRKRQEETRRQQDEARQMVPEEDIARQRAASAHKADEGMRIRIKPRSKPRLLHLTTERPQPQPPNIDTFDTPPPRLPESDDNDDFEEDTTPNRLPLEVVEAPNTRRHPQKRSHSAAQDDGQDDEAPKGPRLVKLRKSVRSRELIGMIFSDDDIPAAHPLVTTRTSLVATSADIVSAPPVAEPAPPPRPPVLAAEAGTSVDTWGPEATDLLGRTRPQKKR